MWDLRRKLSVQECIALQGFPKTFRFPVSENQAYKQLGNSVALPVVSAISKLLIKHLIK
jgi:DNA (cytosine-5)-methyltransferase 1